MMGTMLASTAANSPLMQSQVERAIRVFCQLIQLSVFS